MSGLGLEDGNGQCVVLCSGVTQGLVTIACSKARGMQKAGRKPKPKPSGLRRAHGALPSWRSFLSACSEILYIFGLKFSFNDMSTTISCAVCVKCTELPTLNLHGPAHTAAFASRIQ